MRIVCGEEESMKFGLGNATLSRVQLHHLPRVRQATSTDTRDLVTLFKTKYAFLVLLAEMYGILSPLVAEDC